MSRWVCGTGGGESIVRLYKVPEGAFDALDEEEEEEEEEESEDDA